MAYVKQTWQTGDTVTAEKLNHMEDGIASAGGSGDILVVSVSQIQDSEYYQLNKTANEILGATYAVFFEELSSQFGDNHIEWHLMRIDSMEGMGDAVTLYYADYGDDDAVLFYYKVFTAADGDSPLYEEGYTPA